MTRAAENAAIEARNKHRKHKDRRRKWCTVKPSKPCDHCHGCEGFPDPYARMPTRDDR